MLIQIYADSHGGQRTAGRKRMTDDGRRTAEGKIDEVKAKSLSPDFLTQFHP